jgi:hypothetical protein
MTTTSADRVALILDCLGHEDTELTGQPRLWQHRDGRYLTEDEATMIEECTLGEIRRAMDLWQEELNQLEEHNQLRAEFLAIVDPYRINPGEPSAAVIARLPEADLKRAAEIWQRIGPSFEAWQQDRS